MRSRWATWGVAVLAAVLGAVVLVPAVSAGRESGEYTLGAEDDTTTPFNLVSVPALIRHRYDGHALRIGPLQAQDRWMRRWAIAYRGDGLRLTGTLIVPRTRGRHPLVVTTHGWIRPPRYRTGIGLRREEERLARLGFAVLHPDYRNFGGSQHEPNGQPQSPLGYPADVLNAVVALHRAHLRSIDLHHVALLGRSMGGGVAMQAAVARPRWFDALVLSSPVSSSAAENYGRWVVRDPSLQTRVRRTYGTPATQPEFWRRASVRDYLGRLTMPVQIHHGTRDRMCPEFWSLETAGAMRAAGVDVRLYTYSGEHHRFSVGWARFMHRTDAFLRTAARAG